MGRNFYTQSDGKHENKRRELFHSGEYVYHGFFYDAAMFRELGLEVPNTWDDLMDVCETLKENGIAPVTLDGTTDLHNEWWFIRFAERNDNGKNPCGG